MKWAILAVAVSSLGGVSHAQADTILKCIDKAGQITFTQGHCPSNQSLADRIEVDNPPPRGSGPVTRMADPTPPPVEKPRTEPRDTTSRSTTRTPSDTDRYYDRDDDDYDAPPPLRQDRYYPPEPYYDYGGHRPPWHNYPRPTPPAPQPAPEPAPRPSVTERGRAAIEQKKAQVEAQKAERQRLLDQR